MSSYLEWTEEQFQKQLLDKITLRRTIFGILVFYSVSRKSRTIKSLKMKMFNSIRGFKLKDSQLKTE